MEPETEEIARARQMLADEMASTHAAFVRLHESAGRSDYLDTRRDCWKVAARLMSAQVSVVNMLKRLSDRRDGFTFTYIHQGSPSGKKLKTNGPVRSVLNVAAVEKADHTEAEINP